MSFPFLSGLVFSFLSCLVLSCLFFVFFFCPCRFFSCLFLVCLVLSVMCLVLSWVPSHQTRFSCFIFIFVVWSLPFSFLVSVSYSSRVVVRDARYDRKRELRHCEAVQRPAHKQFVCDEDHQQTGVLILVSFLRKKDQKNIYWVLIFCLSLWLLWPDASVVAFVPVLKHQEMDKKTRRNQALRKQVALWLCFALVLSWYCLVSCLLLFVGCGVLSCLVFRCRLFFVIVLESCLVLSCFVSSCHASSVVPLALFLAFALTLFLFLALFLVGASRSRSWPRP